MALEQCLSENTFNLEETHYNNNVNKACLKHSDRY